MQETLAGIEVGKAIMENYVDSLHESKNKWPYNIGSLLLGIYVKEMKSVCQRDTFCTPMFTEALFEQARHGSN